MFYDNLTVDERKYITCCTYIIEIKTRLDVDWVHLGGNRCLSKHNKQLFSVHKWNIRQRTFQKIKKNIYEEVSF